MTTQKTLSQNCTLIIDIEQSNLLELALDEARKVFKNKDAILIYTYLLLKNSYKQANKDFYIKLNTRTNYAKQLYNEIKNIIKEK